MLRSIIGGILQFRHDFNELFFNHEYKRRRDEVDAETLRSPERRHQLDHEIRAKISAYTGKPPTHLLLGGFVIRDLQINIMERNMTLEPGMLRHDLFISSYDDLTVIVVHHHPYMIEPVYIEKGYQYEQV